MADGWSIQRGVDISKIIIRKVRLILRSGDSLRNGLASKLILHFLPILHPFKFLRVFWKIRFKSLGSRSFHMSPRIRRISIFAINFLKNSCGDLENLFPMAVALYVSLRHMSGG
jgi:hypothetical protein